MIGTLLGVMLFGVLQNGLDLLSVQPYWQTFITGVVLVAAITIDQLFRRRQQVEI
jgi:ribose/xylose/arabinose/galactoside ABC-type transport system permease subunit